MSITIHLICINRIPSAQENVIANFIIITEIFSQYQRRFGFISILFNKFLGKFRRGGV